MVSVVVLSSVRWTLKCTVAAWVSAREVLGHQINSVEKDNVLQKRDRNLQTSWGKNATWGFSTTRLPHPNEEHVSSPSRLQTLNRIPPQVPNPTLNSELHFSSHLSPFNNLSRSQPLDMAHTRSSPRENAQCPGTTEPVIPAVKTAPQKKRSREADDTAIIRSDQPEPAKKAKTTASKMKHQHETVAAAVVESEQPVPTKKARSTATNTKKSTVTQVQSPARHSTRNQPKTPGVTKTRKRRSKEEIAAEKAKAEMEKRRLEELTKENNQAMMRIDIDEDIDRAETAARTIRTFTDLNRDSESDGEEFVGYNEVSSGDESDSAEDAVTLKVRCLSQLGSTKSTHLT